MVKNELFKIILKLKTAYIRTIIISEEIRGQTIDYTITFTVFGEVLNVNDNFWTAADFYNLPATAQELMLGKNAKEVFRRIKAECVLWAYKFPLMGLGFRQGKGHQELMDLRGENPNYRQLNKATAIESEWVKAAYIGVEKAEIRDQFRFLNRCFDGDFSFKRNSFPLTNYDTELMLPPLLTMAICAFDDSKNKGALINLLRYFPNDQTFDFIAEQLKNDAFKSMHPRLIYALNTATNPELIPLLLSYFEKHQTHPKIEKINTLLTQFHTIDIAEVKEVYAAILYYEGRNVRDEGIAILVKESRRIKVGQAKWVDLILENRAIIKQIASLAKQI